MKWHVISRVGESDNYSCGETQELRPLVVAFERPGDPARMRHRVLDQLEDAHGDLPNDTVVDLLYLTMAVYAADMLIPRASADDRWTRSIEVCHPVADVARWNDARSVLEDALGFLTGDIWQLMFRHREVSEQENADGASTSIDRVVLCSGGLDSLAGSIEYAEAGEKLCLVGHHGGGLTARFQHAVMDGLSKCYQDQVSVDSFHVLPPQAIGEGESTMRSRSLLFIGLGLATANAVGGGTPLSVPENGLITLNVPLTGPRNGSASTRTTHPWFIGLMNDVLAHLAIPHTIELPYRFSTKGEMLSAADGDALRQLLSATMSCSHPEVSRWAGMTPGTHCGYCVPCMIRRGAVHHANMEDADASYVYDVLDTQCHLQGDKARDLRALKTALTRLKHQGTRRDIFTVLDSGPLPPDHVKSYAGVYRRGMKELADMLGVDI